MIFKDIANIKTGKLDANASTINGKYPFFTCSKEISRIDTYAYDTTCVLLGGNGEFNVHYYSGKFNAYQRTYIIESKDENKYSSKLMYYLVQKKISKFKEKSSGTVIKFIRLGDVEKIEFPNIEINEQKKLLNKIENIEFSIQKEKANVLYLNNLIKSRFNEMFGNLETTKFNIRLIEELTEFVKDGTHSTPTYTEDTTNGVKFLSSKDVVSGSICWDNIKYIPLDLHKELCNRVSPKRNDILLAKNGTTGICAINDTDEIFDIYVSLALLRFKPGININYIHYAINSKDTKEQFDSRLKGVGVPNLHLGEIKKTKLIVPPLELQNKFASFAEHIDKLKFNIENIQ